MILSSNDPDDVTYARCYCGSPINKTVAQPLQTLILGGFHSRRQAAKLPRARAIVDLSGACVVIESSPEPPRHC
jgi:hypothetical protein